MNTKVILAGAGCGSGTQTRELQEVLAGVCCVAGPQRLLDTIRLPENADVHLKIRTS